MNTSDPAPSSPLRQRLRTLLVPTDFSGPAADALRHAEQLAKHTGARLVLLYVFDDTEFAIGSALGLGGPEGPAEVNRTAARILAGEKLHALAERVRAGGYPVEALIVVGSPVEIIIHTATEQRADLIVMSTHGRTGWRRLVLGSVAEQVVRYAPCPVLALHAHRAANLPPAAADATGLAAAPLQLRRILVSSDFSARSEAALPWAEELAREAGAQLTLLHVMPPFDATSSPFDPAFALASPALAEAHEAAIQARHAKLQAMAREAAERGNRVEAVTISGAADEKIVESAHDGLTDLIVIASHGVTNWSQALLGRTTERVVRTASCPVLVVREQ